MAEFTVTQCFPTGRTREWTSPEGKTIVFNKHSVQFAETPDRLGRLSGLVRISHQLLVRSCRVTFKLGSLAVSSLRKSSHRSRSGVVVEVVAFGSLVGVVAAARRSWCRSH